MFGVKADDQRGVLVEVKNAMIMDSMFIVMLDDCMSIGLAVEEGMAVAEVAPIGMSIDGDAESMMVIVVLSRRVPRYDEGEQKLVE